MAEEEEGTENEEAQSDESVEQPKKKGKKLLLIVGGLILLVLLIGAPVLYFVLAGEDPEDAKELDANAAEQKELVLMMEGFDEEDEQDENDVPLGAFYPFETFVVNLSKGGYLRCQAHVEFSDRDIPKRFHSKIIPIRDGLVNLLSNQTRKGLATEDGRGELKIAIRTLINEVLRKEVVKRVYFTQFVIQ